MIDRIGFLIDAFDTHQTLLANDIRRLGQVDKRSLGMCIVGHLGDDHKLRIRDHVSIQLLVTDVVMPELSGWELGEALRAYLPDLKVLYVSGYSHDQFQRGHRRLEDGQFLAKPYNGEALTKKVREVLDT